MNDIRAFPLATTHIERLIHRSWREFTQARVDGDISAMTRAEQRMNSLLEELHARRHSASE